MNRLKTMTAAYRNAADDLRFGALVVNNRWVRRATVAGTAVLMGGLLAVMLREPFEYVDDLLWLQKLSAERFIDIPFVSAWTDTSPFYRPGAELMLKLFFSVFGFNLAAYRVFQWAALLLLLYASARVIRRLNLRPETILLLAVFLIGSPFISGSIVWLSELPHVAVLIFFAVGLEALLSDRSGNWKLAICATSFVGALSMKENGVALLIFYPFLVRAKPWSATIIFGTIVVGYFVLRASVLGSHMGLANASQVDRYLYLVNIISQNIALWTRLTKWGELAKEFGYETVIQIASTAGILLAANSFRKSRTALLLAGVAFGSTVLSYAYARDRHLALPAYAYGLLLLMAVDVLAARWRILIFFAWIAWAAQAALTIRGVHRASVDLIHNVYVPNTTPLVKGTSQEVWTIARDNALSLPH